MTKTAQTAAQKISTLLGDDGLRWESRDGRGIAQLCEDHGASGPYGQSGRGTMPERYDFDDGSSIVVTDGGWDLGLSQDCYCWVGVGHDENCTLDTDAA